MMEKGRRTAPGSKNCKLRESLEAGRQVKGGMWIEVRREVLGSGTDTSTVDKLEV